MDRHVLALVWPLTLALGSACSQPQAELPPIVTGFEGRVVDGATGAPLANVTVRTEPASESVTSDSDGRYAIADLTPQTVYRVVASADGYLTGQGGFATVEGATAGVDLLLFPLEPVLYLGRSSVDFGTAELTQTLAIANEGGGELEWSISTAAAWLSFEPSSGTIRDIPSIVRLSADRAGLADTYGTLSATATVTSAAGTEIVTVSIVNPSPDEPQFAASPLAIDFRAHGVERFLNLRNTGTGTLNWTLAGLPAWLTGDVGAGDLGAGQLQRVRLIASRDGLEVGLHSAALTVSDGSDSFQAAVALEVVERPLSAVVPNAIDFGLESTTEGFAVQNIGTGPMVFQVSPIGVPWLSSSSSAVGTWTALAAGASAEVPLAVDRDRLGAGSQSYQVVIRSNQNHGDGGAGGDRSVIVSASRQEAPALGVPVEPVVISDSDRGEVEILNTGTGVLSWEITSTPSWLTATPTSGEVATPDGAATQGVAVPVVVNLEALQPGEHSGTVTVEGAGGSANITVVVRVSGFAWESVDVSGPAPRQGAMMAMAAGELLLFGGAGASGNLDDTWRFDGVAWNQDTEGDSPSARAFGSMAVGPNGKVWLWGGGQAVRDDDGGHVWSYDLDTSTWSLPEPCSVDNPDHEHLCHPTTGQALSHASILADRLEADDPNGFHFVSFGGVDPNGGAPRVVEAVSTGEGRGVITPFDNRWLQSGNLPFPMVGTQARRITETEVHLIGTPCHGGTLDSCLGMAVLIGPTPVGRANTFELGPTVSLDLQRHGFASFASGRALYAVGGLDREAARHAGVVRVDDHGNAHWAAANSGPQAHSGAAIAFEPTAGVGYLFAGETDAGLSNALWRFRLYEWGAP